MGTPIARLFDRVAHPLPGALAPGPGALNVVVGNLPAWRGLPLAMAAGLQAAKATSDAVVNSATAAATAAMGTPAAPAAKAAEEAAKAAAAAAMGGLIKGLSSIPSPSGGVPDTHLCATPLPIPPHGPGVVIDGNPTVLINGLPACQVGDKVLEALGPPDPIIMGCPTVIIGTNGGGGSGGLLNAIEDAVGSAAAKALELLGSGAELAMKFVEAGKAAISVATMFAATVAQAIVDGVKSLIQNARIAVERGVEAVNDVLHDMFPKVKGMDADAADAAIVQAQKDAIAAVDKRIADLDKWDTDTEKSFRKFFGDADQSTRDEVRARMVKTRDKLDSFTLDNYSSDDDAYAFVYPDKDDKIYLGELFASAPEKGRDSRAGTLIHEASHFNSVAGTDDVKHDGHTVYGEAGAAKVATDDPAKAQRNADNFEYFIEDGM